MQMGSILVCQGRLLHCSAFAQVDMATTWIVFVCWWWVGPAAAICQSTCVSYNSHVLGCAWCTVVMGESRSASWLVLDWLALWFSPFNCFASWRQAGEVVHSVGSFSETRGQSGEKVFGARHWSAVVVHWRSLLASTLVSFCTNHIVCLGVCHCSSLGLWRALWMTSFMYLRAGLVVTFCRVGNYIRLGIVPWLTWSPKFWQLRVWSMAMWIVCFMTTARPGLKPTALQPLPANYC